MFKRCLLLIVPFLFISCSIPQETVQPLTQLEKREIQTRTFEDAQMKHVLKAMIDVLQDTGYIVKNANTELGLLVASKEVDCERRSDVLLATLASSSNPPRWKKNAIYEASANVSQIGKNVKVRINFQEKILDNLGAPVRIRQIMDPVEYQMFFEKVSKGLFIYKENI